ncbi:NAD(P)/FAD-dependent oxidoreductase [Stappia stellulata]|uniref:NAD(P)/FAD-dependent oxidoreductase n=1 Tax=Stappia stellulata TaxID=71235 RepID=UPI00048D08E4|nr:FAD-dependent oxidoreductase [Stappia stellulata]
MPDVIVLGAGMVGVSTALALQERGSEVVMLDRGDPVAASSYGNAGIIQVEAAEPYAMPRSFRELAAIALGRSNAVVWHAAALPGALRPLWAYFRNSAPARLERIARTYATLTSRATSDHAPWIEAARADRWIRRDGFRHVFRDPRDLSTAVMRAERVTRDHGVRFEVLDGPALARKEPSLRRPLAGALHWLDPWTCRDPGALVKAYTDLFRSRGGRVLHGNAMTLTRRAGGWHARTNEATWVGAPHAVIAMGMQSAALCRRFGLRVPLFAKRGYHCHFETRSGPDLPLVDVASSSVLAPMAGGLRILTGAEIAREGAKARHVQLERARNDASELFDLGDPVDPVPWLGTRPCMPDMLPVLGGVPDQPGLWAHFGHGHQGFTLGPTTAAILAEEMTGGAPVPSALTPARLARQ